MYPVMLKQQIDKWQCEDILANEEQQQGYCVDMLSSTRDTVLICQAASGILC